MLNNFPDFLSGRTDSLVVLHNLPESSRLHCLSGGQDMHSMQNDVGNKRMTENALYLADLMQRNSSVKSQLTSRERQLRAWKLCGALMALLSVFFQVSLHDLRSPQRGNCHVARIRQFGMYIAHTMFGLSMSEVAYAFCRERTTVKHACHLIEDMRENEKFDRSVSSFEYLIRALYPCGSAGE